MDQKEITLDFKYNFFKYRKELTGKIEYERSHPDMNSFVGRMKLKCDPVSEQINIENFILKGSKVASTNWTFLMVIYTHNNCKIYQNCNFEKKKQSYLLKNLNMYFMIHIVMLILMIIIVIQMEITSQEFDSFINSFTTYQSEQSIKFFQFLIIYGPFVPLMIYPVIDIITLLQSEMYVQNFKSDSKGQNRRVDRIQIKNPDVVSELASIEYVLMDKTGTLTTNKLRIRSMVISGKLFWFKDHDQKKMETFFKLDSLFEKEAMLREMNKTAREIAPYTMKGRPTIKAIKQFNIHATQSFCVENNTKAQNFFMEVKEKVSNFKDQEEDVEEEDDQISLQSNKTLDPNSHKIKKSTFENFIKGGLDDDDENESDQESSSDDDETSMSIDDISNLESDDNEDGSIRIYNGDVFNKYFSRSMKNYIELEKLLETMALAQNARVRKLYIKDRKEILSVRYEEPEIIKFIQSFGYDYEGFNSSHQPTKCFLRRFDEKNDKDVIGLNNYCDQRKRTSVVIRDEYDRKKAKILVKGDENMINVLVLNLKEQKILDKSIEFYKKKGLIPIIYAQRELNNNEIRVYEKRYNNLKQSLVSKKDDLRILANEFETKLTLTGILGLEEQVRDGAKELIQTLQKANIKTWMLTGDDLSRAENCSKVIRLYPIFCENIQPRFITKEQAKIFIRQQLKDIKHIIDEFTDENIKKYEEQDVQKTGKTKKKVVKMHSIFQRKTTVNLILKDEAAVQKLTNKCLKLSGAQLDIIWKDRYLLDHFAFILSFINYFIGYSLSAENKANIAKIITKNFKNNPHTLCIGDGLNDICMMQECNVSIEFCENYELSNDSGDFKMNNLMQIKDLLLVYGRQSQENMDQLIIFGFYQGFLLILPSFFFSWMSAFTGSLFVSKTGTFLVSTIFMVIPQIVFGITNIKYNKILLRRYPTLYTDGILQKRYLKWGLMTLLEGVIHGVVIYTLQYTILKEAVSQDGNTFGLAAIQLSTFLCIFLVLNMKILIMGRLTWVSMIVCFFLFALGIQISVSFRLARATYYYYIMNMVSSTSDCLLSILLTVMLCIFISFIFHNYFQHYFYPTLYSKLPNGSVLIKQKISNKEIQTMKKKMNFKNDDMYSDRIKSAFKNVDQIDDIVQESNYPTDIPQLLTVLSPINNQINNITVDPITLQFQSSSLEEQYRLQIQKRTELYTREIYSIVLVVYFFYIIVKIRADYSANSFMISFFLGIIGIIFGVTLFSSFYYEKYRFFVFVVTLFYIFQPTKFIFFSMLILLFLNLLLKVNLVLGAVLFPVVSCLNYGLGQYLITILNLIHLSMFFMRIYYYFENYKDYLLIVDIQVLNGDQIESIKVYIYSVYFMIVFVISFLSIFIAYRSEKQGRMIYRSEKKIQRKKHQNKDLMSILVPEFVREKIERREKNELIAETHKDVTVIFVDLYGFCSLIAVAKEEIVNILDEVFRTFDELCTLNGIQKIETVGKTYMAAGGLKSCESWVQPLQPMMNHTKRTINLAIAMMKYIKTVNWEQNKLKLKIGIHRGQVVAGVIGFHKPQFSLIGDTVNTTARHCSTSEPGMITISEEAYQQVKGTELQFNVKTSVPMKGKGLRNVYQLITEGKLKKKKHKISLWKHKMKKIAQKSNTKQFKFGKGNLVMQKLDLKIKLNLLQNNGLFSTIKEAQKAEKFNLKALQLLKQNEKGKTKRKNQKQHDEYVSSDDEIQDEDDTKLLEANPYTLLIPKQQKDKQFEIGIFAQNRLYYRVIWFLYIVTYIVITYFFEGIMETIPSSKNFLLILGRALFVLTSMIIFIWIKLNQKMFLLFLVFVYGLICSFGMAEASPLVEMRLQIYLLEVTLLFMVFIFGTRINFLYGIAFSIIMVGFSVLVYLYFGGDIIGMGMYMSTMIGFLLHKQFQKIKREIEKYNNIQSQANQQTDQANLVSNLLPEHIADQLLSEEGQQKNSEVCEQVTMLYADITSFTKYTSTHTPDQVIQMLQNLFTKFDQEAQKLRLYKVCTIGDCYVAIGFINANKRDAPHKECLQVVKLAESMITIIQQVKKEIQNDQLDMRIGIHVGSFIGGVIGTDIVRYDIYGPDPLIANQMEAGGIPGLIQISRAAKKMIEDHYPNIYRYEKNPKHMHIKDLAEDLKGWFIYQKQEVCEEEMSYSP